MPTRKITEIKTERWLPPQVCRSPDHNPPSHCVFEPGLYEHTCSACGEVTMFLVRGVSYSTNAPVDYDPISGKEVLL